jgi:DNA-binding Lrp family transcriptional regulator
MNLDQADLRLIDGWQRNFPLIERPFAAIARELGAGEDEVIRRLDRLRSLGVLARVGATLVPNTAGASTLAAMRVPIGRLDEVQRLVSAEPCVNHNYEREHEVNLWFVAAGADRAAIDATLARIRDGTGLEVLDLPLLRAFRLCHLSGLPGSSAERRGARLAQCTERRAGSAAATVS